MENKPKKIKKALIGGYNKVSVKKNIEQLERRYEELINEERKNYEEQIRELDREFEKLAKKK